MTASSSVPVEFCRNPDGTVGLDPFGLWFITERQKSGILTKVEFTPFDLLVHRTEYREISVTEGESEDSCAAEEEDENVVRWRWQWEEIISAERVRIFKADRSLFTEETLGISTDKKSVNAFLICSTYLEWRHDVCP